MSATVLKDSIEILSNDFKRSAERKGKLYKGIEFFSYLKYSLQNLFSASKPKSPESNLLVFENYFPMSIKI